MILLIPIFVLLADSLYPGRFHKLPFRLLTGITAAAPLLYIILPTKLTSDRFLDIFLIIASPLVLYYLIRLPGVLKGGTKRDWLAVSGLFILLTTDLLEMPLYDVLPPVARSGLMPAGMLVFAVCYMMLLRLRAEQASLQLTEAKRNTDFFRKMSHDLRTPLTVTSTSVQLARNRPDEAEALLTDSQSEIMKMAEMIDDALKSLSYG